MRLQDPAWLTASLTVLLSAAGAAGQSTFANLNFESPILPLVQTPPGSGLVPITNAMPGWTGYTYGPPPDSVVRYNQIAIGASSIDFLGPGSGYQPFEGSYFVLLQPSSVGTNVPAIAQLGTVPTTAQSVRYYGTSAFSVSFGGHQIPLSVLGNTPSYTIYGGDVSSFAGQTGWLQFQGVGFLDNIFFSNQSVPEPSALGLSALGALLLAWRGLRRRR